MGVADTCGPKFLKETRIKTDMARKHDWVYKDGNESTSDECDDEQYQSNSLNPQRTLYKSFYSRK